MEDEQLREFAAFDGDVAWIVVHGLRRVQPLQLAARRLRLEDQGGKLPGPGVDAGRQAGGATPDDDDVVDHGRPATKALPSSTFSPPTQPWHENPWLSYDCSDNYGAIRNRRTFFRDTFKFVVSAMGRRRRDVAWPSSKSHSDDCPRALRRIRTSTSGS